MSDNEPEPKPPSDTPARFRTYVQELPQRFGEIERVISSTRESGKTGRSERTKVAESSAQHNRQSPVSVNQPPQCTRPASSAAAELIPGADAEEEPQNARAKPWPGATSPGWDNRGTRQRTRRSFSWTDQRRMRARRPPDQAHARKARSSGQRLHRGQHQQGCSPRQRR